MGGIELLFLTQTFPRSAEDTAGPFIRDLARGLVRGGDRVTVLVPHAAGLAERWWVDGVEVETFRYAPPSLERLGYGRSLDADERPKLVAGLVTPLYLVAARWAVRRFVARRPCDLVHAHWVVPNGVAAAPAAGSVPFAVGLHGSDVFLAERPLVRSWVRRALRRARLVTGCSPELVARVCDLGFDRDRSRVIPYGVDTETFRPGPDGTGWRRRLGIPEAAPLALAVGRMATKKGFGVLFEALPAVLAARPEAHVVVAGGGDLLGELRRRAAAFGGRVHLPGPVYRDALPDLYRAASLFALPAVHDRKGNVDGLPNVILEAMASALPVVASDISGIPLAVADGETGILVPEGDAGRLATALARLLGDADLAGRLGAAGRLRAEAHLTWDAVAERYREAYRAVRSGSW